MINECAVCLGLYEKDIDETTETTTGRRLLSGFNIINAGTRSVLYGAICMLTVWKKLMEIYLYH